MADAIRIGALVGSCVLLAAAGCSQFGPSCDTSDNGNPAITYNGGTVTDGVYMSSPYTGKLLSFEGGKRYRVQHKLGCTPSWVILYESFNENGTGAGTIAPCAGNMCEVQRVDQEGILVKNDTCSDFFLLVVAGGPNCSLNLDAGDDGDSGADAASE